MYSTYALAGALMASTASAWNFSLVTAYSSVGLDTMNSLEKTFFFFTQVGDEPYSNFHVNMFDLQANKEYFFEIVEGELACDMMVKFDDLDFGEAVFTATGGDLTLRSKSMLPIKGQSGLEDRFIRMGNDVDGVLACAAIKLTGDDFGTDIFGAEGFPGPNNVDDRSGSGDRGGEREEAVVNSDNSGGWSIDINGGGT